MLFLTTHSSLCACPENENRSDASRHGKRAAERLCVYMTLERGKFEVGRARYFGDIELEERLFLHLLKRGWFFFLNLFLF